MAPVPDSSDACTRAPADKEVPQPQAPQTMYTKPGRAGHTPCTRKVPTTPCGSPAMAGLPAAKTPALHVPKLARALTSFRHDRLGLRVQRPPRRGLAPHGHETFHAQRLPRRLARISPGLDGAAVDLLPLRRHLFRDDLSALAPHQARLRQATLRLLLVPREHRRLRTRPSGHDAHPLRLLHGLLHACFLHHA